MKLYYWDKEVNMKTLILSTRKCKAGYIIKQELIQTEFEAVPLANCTQKEDEIINYINEHQGEHVIIKSVYTPEGDYIGNLGMARFLIKKRGIKPELASLDDKVCSIGFCEKEQKWYGWSHRAIYGFGVGSEVKEGDCCATSGWTEEYLKDHPEADLSLPVGFIARNLIDAKRMAIAFADSVR